MYSNILFDEECVDIIKKKCDTSDFQILSKKIAPISANVNGFLGVHLRATFDIILQGTPTTVQFFIKQPPSDPNHLMNELILESRAYEREAFVYEVFIGRGKQVAWAPTFYLFRDGALIMDDASKNGFTLANIKVNEIDVEHCKVTLKEIAAFHAHTFYLEREKSRQLGRPYRLDEEFADILEEGVFHNKPNTVATKMLDQGVLSICGLIDAMPDQNSLPKEQFKKKFNEMVLRTYELLKPSKCYRNAVCHGDLWLKNLLFKYADGKPEKCLLIDFQVVKYNVPATDVMMFIHINASRAFVQAHLDELLQFYYTQLDTELKNQGMNVQDILPWNEFMQTVAEQKIVSLVMPTIYKTAIIMGDDYFTALTNDMELYRDFMYKNRTKHLLKEYTNDPEYRSKITQIMNDLREDMAKIK